MSTSGCEYQGHGEVQLSADAHGQVDRNGAPGPTIFQWCYSLVSTLYSRFLAKHGSSARCQNFKPHMIQHFTDLLQFRLSRSPRSQCRIPQKITKKLCFKLQSSINTISNKYDHHIKLQQVLDLHELHVLVSSSKLAPVFKYNVIRRTPMGARVVGASFTDTKSSI